MHPILTMLAPLVVLVQASRRRRTAAHRRRVIAFVRLSSGTERYPPRPHPAYSATVF